jgi:hypothetical protein
MKESPIFTRTHDLLLWVLRTTRKFPREFRFTLGQEVCAQAFALQKAQIAASLDSMRQAEHLVHADIALTSLRKLMLLCHELQLLDDGQLRHVGELLQEIGRLLGGWKRSGRGR